MFALTVYVADIEVVSVHLPVHDLSAASLKRTTYHSILKTFSKYKSKMVF
jgi:hypothetical protein